MYKKFILPILLLIISVITTLSISYAYMTVAYPSPAVKNVTSNSAVFEIPEDVLKDLSEYDRGSIYFEYYETNKVCIAIYPTPADCLPKKTKAYMQKVTVTDLKPSTNYTVEYKRDNSIMCIKAPCPSNTIISAQATFTTLASDIKSTTSTSTIGDNKSLLSSNLWLGSRGSQVSVLQNELIREGYMSGNATGYYGFSTMRAVKKFQKDNNISPSGYVGKLTREILNKNILSGTFVTNTSERFEGVVTAFSTACFSDGECSITVDGKKVITTIGWSQKEVGQVIGIPDFGSIEKYVGTKATVYAKKIDGGYTLYGNKDYFIRINTPANPKLPPLSEIPTDPALVQSINWKWEKTVEGGNTTTQPSSDKFSINMGTDNRVTGTTDCNSYFGNYAFGSEGYIRFEAFGSTRMYCEGSLESVFIAQLSRVNKYTINSDDKLVLSSADNTVIMYFVKK